MAEDFPNPLALVSQFALAGHEAIEVLICTFNQNLPFFERSVLGPCRATGGRVTILGDIRMAEHDTAAIGRAGTGYVVANVSAPKGDRRFTRNSSPSSGRSTPWSQSARAT